MCGITGIVDTRGRRAVDRDLLVRMTDRMAHRGPDGTGYHTIPGAGFGHLRLAIIDVAGGQQPLFNEDGTVFVTYNGEIYNYRELVAELTACGHRFRTHSDTEVIVHAWEEWGEACIERFRGMFAFAVWDERKETLFLGRDRLGKKPVHYAVLPDGMLIFGSELKALLCHPNLERRIDPTAVEDYFALGYVPETKCIYGTVRKLPPAHSLTVRRGGPVGEPRCYWEPRIEAASAMPSGAEAAEALRALLRDAVDMRLMSEVPLGAFLSGGVDSSAVVALMADLLSDPVNSFSIGFRQASHDESEYARRVAEQYKTRHHSRIVDADDFDLVDRLPGIYDEPFADPSAIPTLRVSALARENVTVALSGDGGDEAFAGYRRYRWHQTEETVRRLVPAGVRRPLFGALGRLYPQLDWMPRKLRAKATFLELAADTVDGFFLNVSVLNDAVRSRLFTSAFRGLLQGYHAREVLAAPFAAAPTDDPLARIQYVDMKTWLAGDILTKVDRASMAASLETRAPLLDHKVIEWALSLPASEKLRDGIGKSVLKKAFEGRLPDDILYRPKQGFSVPLAAWFRGPLRPRLDAALASGRLWETGWFDRGFVETSLAQHQSGVRDNSRFLWSLLMFDGFLRDVHEGAATTASPGERVSATAA